MACFRFLRYFVYFSETGKAMKRNRDVKARHHQEIHETTKQMK